jgi:hypothetical protein
MIVEPMEQEIIVSDLYNDEGRMYVFTELGDKTENLQDGGAMSIDYDYMIDKLCQDNVRRSVCSKIISLRQSQCHVAVPKVNVAVVLYLKSIGTEYDVVDDLVWLFQNAPPNKYLVLLDSFNSGKFYTGYGTAFPIESYLFMRMIWDANCSFLQDQHVEEYCRIQGVSRKNCPYLQNRADSNLERRYISGYFKHWIETFLVLKPDSPNRLIGLALIKYFSDGTVPIDNYKYLLPKYALRTLNYMLCIRSYEKHYLNMIPNEIILCVFQYLLLV